MKYFLVGFLNLLSDTVISLEILKRNKCCYSMFLLGQLRAKESTKYLLYEHEGSALRFCYYFSLTLIGFWCSEEDFSSVDSLKGHSAFRAFFPFEHK